MADAHDALRTDPTLAPLLDAHGELAVTPHDDLFERLVVAIIRQQLSTDAAATIRERVFDAVDVTPAGIAAADPAVLRDAGLSRQKTDYVTNVAAAFREHDYTRARFAELSDAAVREELTAITGVGDWTASMFLLFALGRADVFPVGDLGIRTGMQALYGADTTRAEMREIADSWRPYRSYASLYVWRAQDT
ncbi:DNA-3-methyladenine glycosylase [Halobacterium salinarum]|uniref:DNA-3-methyladenine glycosylase family protein n=1 Tax=Halobacterium salinarum TaxID=2242 RepID=UPI002556C980|nr:DNA-3-methyladenine glycosylase [Halobacterium salinarum]MDL0139927.1 DNA-3-methyladenine glycosylase [Halobacterium salinarum]